MAYFAVSFATLFPNSHNGHDSWAHVVYANIPLATTVGPCEMLEDIQTPDGVTCENYLKRTHAPRDNVFISPSHYDTLLSRFAHIVYALLHSTTGFSEVFKELYSRWKNHWQSI